MGPPRKENALRRDPQYVYGKTKRWREANPEKAAGQCKRSYASRAERYRANPEQYLWRTARYRANKIDCAFAIQVGDIVIPEFCPITGLRIDVLNANGQSGASIDKVDNALGYVKGNVRVISRKGNRLKSDMSLEQLERILAYMKGQI